MKNILIKAMIDCGYHVRSYSGRGMYEKKCVGFTHSGNSIGPIVNIIVEVHNVISDNDNFEDIISPLKYALIDSMGMDMITYFPEMIWSDGVKELVESLQD